MVKTISTACLRPGAHRACSASPCMISAEDGAPLFLMGTSTVQDLLDWLEVDLGFTKLCLFRSICVF